MRKISISQGEIARIVLAHKETERAMEAKRRALPARKLTFGNPAKNTRPTPEEQNAINAKFWDSRT